MFVLFPTATIPPIVFPFASRLPVLWQLEIVPPLFPTKDPTIPPTWSPPKLLNLPSL